MRQNFFSILNLIAVTALISCEQIDQNKFPEAEEKNTFLASSTFERIKPSIDFYGDIDLKNIKEEVLNDGEITISTFRIPVTKNGRLIGNIIAVDLGKSGFLPFGDTFAVNFEDYSDFNQMTLSGTIEMVDMNYENFVHSKIRVVENKIIDWEGNGLSPKLKAKYSYLRKDSTTNKKLNVRTQTFTCDDNKNGDISFSECYRCVKESIDMDGTSTFLCDIPLSGWIGCWAVSTVFCVFISSNY
jgi:hypothetical protein